MGYLLLILLTSLPELQSTSQEIMRIALQRYERQSINPQILCDPTCLKKTEPLFLNSVYAPERLLVLLPRCSVYTPVTAILNLIHLMALSLMFL
jgi:hypothetical protein